MEYLKIIGGNKLSGEVEISGAKNSALKQIAAAVILANGSTTLHNVPNLSDIHSMDEIIRILGGEVEFKNNTIKIDASDLSSSYVPFSLASKLRASFVFLGALLARFKEAKVAFPGGCNIGARKVDLHLKGLKALGAQITEEQGYVFAKADKLIGTKIYLDIPSNGATENIMLAATMAEGETVIENAAQDPEIVDLANFLNKMGCDIRGAGSSNIHIYGKTLEDLHSVEHFSIPDRIEAATYLLAAPLTTGKVTVKNVLEEDLQSLLSKVQDANVKIEIHNTGRFIDDRELVNISAELVGDRPTATDITTVWYPGFPTDIQPMFSTMLTVAEGSSVVVENIYDSRFAHLDELKRMGSNHEINGKVAILKGTKTLKPASVEGKDLRGTAALAIAALAAEGTSEVRGLQFLDRGYENFVEKFTALGANIERVNENDKVKFEEAVKA